MPLNTEFDQVWNDSYVGILSKLRSWVLYSKGTREILNGLKNYKLSPRLMSYIRIKSNSVSIRFKGQEVAELKMSKGILCLKISSKSYKNNKNWFTGYNIPPGTYDWHSNQAAQFRNFFNRLPTNTRVKSPEHYLESRIIKEMMREDGAKFDGSFKGVQPVCIVNSCGRRFPLQVPVPISGSRGEPINRPGHIDILARRNGKNAISIWELKRPGAITDSLIRQAYIYGLNILYVLSDNTQITIDGETKECRQWWYKILGFNGRAPDKLQIEVCAVVSADQREKLVRQYRNERSNLPLKISRGSIQFKGVFYSDQSLSLCEEDLEGTV